jgi:hypothetical protein
VQCHPVTPPHALFPACCGAGIVRMRGAPGRLARWLKSYTADTAFRRLSSNSCLALPSLYVELPRRGGFARRAWARPLLRNRPELRAKIRSGDRATTTAAPPSAEQPVASGRDGGPDRRRPDVPLACCRPRGRGPDHFLGVDRANPADHPGTEVLLDALDGRRCRGAHEARLELLAMGSVVDPVARRCDPLAGGDHRGVADEGDQFAVAARLWQPDSGVILMCSLAGVLRLVSICGARWSSR